MRADLHDHGMASLRVSHTPLVFLGVVGPLATRVAAFWDEERIEATFRNSARGESLACYDALSIIHPALNFVNRLPHQEIKEDGGVLGDELLGELVPGLTRRAAKRKETISTIKVEIGRRIRTLSAI